MLRISLLTALSMIAFAANSLLTRLALVGDPPLIDAASFASLRVMSGAFVLWLILLIKGIRLCDLERRWKMPFALLVYIVGFSFAYLSLGTGTGALILFGTVQLTMFAYAISKGEHFSALSWTGFVMAIGGILYLLLPGAAAPNMLGAILMVLAGIGWAAYSLLGRAVKDPLQATAWSFGVCIPLILLVSLPFVNVTSLSAQGAVLAMASGGLASGLGYVLWYAVLPFLSVGRAASVQLSVPILAVLGGALFLSELITHRIIIASVATLCGIALVLMQRAKK